jgi:hypothetical protein
MMNAIPYALRHVVIVGVTALATGYVATKTIPMSFVAMLNQEQFYQAAVTFTTGAMIAIFVAVFYSDAKRMKVLRELPGALTIYMVVLFDLMVITFTGLFLEDGRLTPLIIVIFYVTHLVYVIARLAGLALKNSLS